jgi:hypothetical protein
VIEVRFAVVFCFIVAGDQAFLAFGVAVFRTRTLTALRVFQRRWGSNGLGPGCE